MRRCCRGYSTSDGCDVMVSLDEQFASTVCVRCQVGSKASSVVCEELVGSAFGAKHVE